MSADDTAYLETIGVVLKNETVSRILLLRLAVIALAIVAALLAVIALWMVNPC